MAVELRQGGEAWREYKMKLGAMFKDDERKRDTNRIDTLNVRRGYNVKN